MNRFPMSILIHKIQISSVKYYPSSLPNLARLQTEKFLVFANKVLEWYEHMRTNFP